MPVLCMHASSVCLLYRELTPKMTIIRVSPIPLSRHNTGAPRRLSSPMSFLQHYVNSLGIPKHSFCHHNYGSYRHPFTVAVRNQPGRNPNPSVSDSIGERETDSSP